MTNKLLMYAPSEQVIPRQNLSPFLRWPLRVLAYPIMLADLLAIRIAYWVVRPKYIITGQCQKSGNCCKYIHLSWPKKSKYHLFSKIYIFWQTEVLGFYFKNFDFVEDSEVTKVMGCRYLRSDGRCAHYKLRPGICRNWPKLHSLRKPSILKGCGYRAVLRKKSTETHSSS